MTLYNVGTISPVRVVSKGDGNGGALIVNRDITGQLVYGDQSITNLNVNEFSVIDPLGSVNIDDSSDVYLLAVSGPVIADVVPGASGWVASPAQVAAQIQALGLATASNQGTQITQGATVASNTGTTASNTGTTSSNTATTASNVAGLTVGGFPGGVPILRGTDNLGTGTGATLAAGASVTLLNAVSIAKPCFESIFKLNLPLNSGTKTFARLNVNWTDSATGLSVGFKQYILIAGNGPSDAITIYLSGPCRGNQITLTLVNLDPGFALTYTWAFNVTSHQYLVDRLIQPSYPLNAPNGWIIPAGNPAMGTVFLTAPVINQGATVQRLSAASNAKCKLTIDNSNGALSMTTIIGDAQTLYAGPTATTTLYKVLTAANVVNNLEFQFPNGPLLFTLSAAAGAGSITPFVSATSMEY